MHLCVIAFALLWNWTSKPGACELWKQQVKGANKSKPAARAVHLQAQFNADALYFITLVFTRRIRIPDLLQHLFSLSHPDFFLILILVRRHRVVTVRVPLRTFLCMNDCTLPIHLNSILHITSTLIWATKCVFVRICVWVFLVSFVVVFFVFYRCSHCSCHSMNFTGVAATAEWIPLLRWLFPEVDQPSTMTARDGNALLLIFAHLLSSIKLL